MAKVNICDGRTQLYRWDTGVKIEMCGCTNVTECHFVTADGVIRRDVEDNICDVPDVALTKAGMLVVYAFARTADEGVTRHEFRIAVLDRPKPADYIDPPDEYENLDALAERVAELIPGGGGSVTPEQIASAVEDYLTENPVEVEETDPTVPEWAKAETKPTYTAEEVGALPADTVIPEQYVLPVATADTLGGVKVGAGLEMNGDMLGVKEGEYELIETIILEEDAVIERTAEPDGTPYNFNVLALRIKKPQGIVLAETLGTTAETKNNTFHSLYFLATTNTEERWAYASVEKHRGKWLRKRSPGWDVYNSTMYSYEVVYPMFDNSAKDDVIDRLYSSRLIPAGLVIEIWGVRADA